MKEAPTGDAAHAQEPGKNGHAGRCRAQFLAVDAQLRAVAILQRRPARLVEVNIADGQDKMPPAAD